MIQDIPTHPMPAFYLAMAQFNRHDFWVCHETLETEWLQATGPLKTFLQGIIQVAAGFHHVTHGNRRGALNLLAYALDKLQSISPEYGFHTWLELERFQQEVLAVRQALENLPQEANITALKQNLPLIHLP